MNFGELFSVFWDFLKANTAPIQGILAILAIISFFFISIRRFLRFGGKKLPPSSNMALESTVPTDQIAPTKPIGTAPAVLSLTEKPSIAVLAFQNMSGDPEQDYFSDGISEDIITDLSSISGLLVIARNSSFVYKGKAVDVRQVGRELGAGYVLEGSVRNAGSRVRITAQLIDAATGNHMWAKRFDRNLDDIFAVQDEITEEIVTALSVNLLDGELERVWQKYLKTYEARALYRSGVQFFRHPTKEGNIDARQKFEQVMSLEPESPTGYNATGWSHWWDARYGWSDDPTRSLALASELVRESLEKDDKYPTAKSLLASVFLLKGEFERAIELGKQAEMLAPNHAHIVAFLAGILNYSGNPKEAIGKAQKAIRLAPSTPSWYLALLASAFYGCGRFEEAIQAGQEGIAINQEEQDARLYKAAAHEALGQHDEAAKDVKTALESVPDFSLTAFARTQPYKDQAVLDGLLDLLRKAGLPE